MLKPVDNADLKSAWESGRSDPTWGGLADAEIDQLFATITELAELVEKNRQKNRTAQQRWRRKNYTPKPRKRAAKKGIDEQTNA